MTKTLYVGNLPWSTTEEDLAALFGATGEVKSTRIITDRESGRSRGLALSRSTTRMWSGSSPR